MAICCQQKYLSVHIRSYRAQKSNECAFQLLSIRQHEAFANVRAFCKYKRVEKNEPR